MNTENLDERYGPCPQCGTWHDQSRACVRCMNGRTMSRCHRCGEDRHCSLWNSIALCARCVLLILTEWKIRFEEIGELK
jgi:hypothetical protein